MIENNRVLIIFAHPNRGQSRVQAALLRAVQSLDGITVVDLYEEYPDFMIDVKREQKRLEGQSLLIFQHPVYWYSCPPLMKEWLDVVLEFGWAYGEGGTKTRGLDFLQVLSSGGAQNAYLRAGYNRFTIHEFMRPFEATANLCGWRYHKPFMVQGVRDLSPLALQKSGEQYRDLLMNYRVNGREVLDALDTTVDPNASVSQ